VQHSRKMTRTKSVSSTEVQEIPCGNIGDGKFATGGGVPQRDSSSLDIDGDVVNDEYDGDRKEVNTSEGGLALGVVKRILSRRSAVVSTREQEPPPDGGLKAWLQGMKDSPPM
jgi:hypothetical protein